MATQSKRPSFTSPKGVFNYPSLSQPDYGNAAFPDPDGAFKVKLILGAAEAQALIDKLTPIWQDAISEGAAKYAAMPIAARKKHGLMKEQPFYSEEFDKTTEEPTGNVIFNFKTKYKILDRKTNEVRYNKIGLFDAKGTPLAAGTLIYGGTVGKVSFQTGSYFVPGTAMAGLSLRLQAAQIIELVGPGARSSSQFGFSAEAGYETSEADGTDIKAAVEEQGANVNPDDF